MTTESANELLNRLPEIAKVINAFQSEAAQLRVLDEILRRLEADAGSGPRAPETKIQAQQPVTLAALSESRKEGKPAPGKASKASKKQETVSHISDLNLRPKGKQTLREFFDQKKPKSNEQLFAVIVYYLDRILDVSGISADHIYTALKELELRVPSRLRTVMSNSAARHHWIDTSDKLDVKLTVHGENFVEHDLPAAQ